MKYDKPYRLSVPDGHTLRSLTSFTPSCTHLLGTAFDRSRRDGDDISVLRWDRQGNVEVVVGRLRDGHNNRVLSTDAGLIVFSATRVHDGVSKPLAFTVGSSVVTDLGAPYPGATVILGMNAHGVFVGSSKTPTGSIGFVGTVNGMRVIEPPARASEVSAKAITDDGVVLGTWQRGPAEPVRAFVERGGVTEDLGELTLFTMNQARLALGRPSSGPTNVYGVVDLEQRPVVWRQLAPPKGEDQVWAGHIDDLGRVSGYAWLSTNPWFAAETFVSEDGAAHRLADLFGTGVYNGLVHCMGRNGAIAVQMHGGGHYLAEPLPAAPVATDPRAAVGDRLRRR